MRVFILCTGRSGSTAMMKACKHITNFTSGHETLSNQFGENRFDYADQHIESDNRLSWDLGQLQKRYGDDAFYVHLKRNRKEVAKSFMNRFYRPGSIIDAFCEGIRMTHTETLTNEQRLQVCYDYIDTVNANIEQFLRDKSKCITIELENMDNDFPDFWGKIGAQGNLKKAMDEFEVRHNATPKKNKLNLKHRFKLFLMREWKYIKLERNKTIE